MSKCKHIEWCRIHDVDQDETTANCQFEDEHGNCVLEESLNLGKWQIEVEE